MINRLLLSLIAVAAMALPLNVRAITPEDAFVNAPSSVIPLIEKSTRLDMIDYFNAGSDRPSRNVLYGNSRITALSPEHIVIEATAASTLEIIALPSGNDTILAVIHTLATPVPDSRLALYTSEWEELPSRSYTAPDLVQWIAPGASRDEVESLLPFMLASCAYSPETGEFIFTNRLSEFLSEEVYEPLKPLVRPTLTYVWDGKRMNLRK